MNPNKGGIPAIDKITNIIEVVINPNLEKSFKSLKVLNFFCSNTNSIFIKKQNKNIYIYILIYMMYILYSIKV